MDRPSSGRLRAASSRPGTARLRWDTGCMSSEQGERPVQRARSAGARVQELADRLTELREAQPPTEASCEQTERSASRAADRADAALRRVAEAHHRAAAVHSQAADLLDKLGQPDRAAEHRRLAKAQGTAGNADERRYSQLRRSDRGVG